MCLHRLFTEIYKSITQPLKREIQTYRNVTSVSVIMFRGRKRKLPSCYIPEPFFHGSDSEENERIQVPNDLGPLHLENRNVNPTRLLQLEGLVNQHQEVQHRYHRDLQIQRLENNQQEEHRPQGPPSPNLQQLANQQHYEDSEHSDSNENYDNEHDDDEQEEEEDKEEEEEGILILIPDEQQEEQEQEEEDGQDEGDGEEMEEEEEEEEMEEEKEEEDIDVPQESYNSILEALSEKWMLAELDHTISKVASNAIWKIAFSFIPKLMQAKSVENVKRKVPGFDHIRKKMYEKRTPKVQLQIGYKNKLTNEVSVVHETATPQSRFPPDKFEKLYEVATVKVITSSISISISKKLLN